MSDEVPIRCEGFVVEGEAGVRLLVVTFEGTYGYGCQGNGDAMAMLEAVERFVREHPEAEGAVLDATRLDYEWGDLIGRVGEPLAAMPWAWAVSKRSAGRFGLTSYVEAEMGMRPEEWLFGSRALALAEIGRRCRGAYELHDARGGLSLRSWPDARGRLEAAYNDEGGGYESLWVGRRLIELRAFDAAGATTSQVFWPFADATGAESVACRLGARVVREGGRVHTLDFDPAQTGRPRVASWLGAVAACPELETLGLDGEGTTDDDVEAALRACPRLKRLCLNGARVTAKALARIAEAGHLTDVEAFSCDLPRDAIKALTRARPGLHFGHDRMFDRDS